MRTLPRLLLAAVLTSTLAACGFSVEAGSETGGDEPTEAPADDTTDDDMGDDSSDETSMPADEDAEPTGEVTQAEAEAVGTAYLGLTEEEAEAQAGVDGRAFRVGERDGEQFALTEDYVPGRVTATVTDGVITAVVVESTDGPVTISE